MELLKIGIIILVVYAVIGLTFRYFITTNKLEPSKLSKLFYSDGKSFVKSWNKKQEKGMLWYILKNIIIMTVIIVIIVMFFLLNKSSMYKDIQSQTLVTDLSQGFIIGLGLCLIKWIIDQNRYRQLKEKEKMKLTI